MNSFSHLEFRELDWAKNLLIFGILQSIYLFWLANIWPGVLGQDSLAVLLEIKNPGIFDSHKPTLWVKFVEFFNGAKQAEYPIIAILALSAAICTRILSWCLANSLLKTFWFLLIFICLAPHFIYFISSLYPDGGHAIGIAGLIFELWLIASTRTLSMRSATMVAICLPLAVFFRPNGLLYLIPIFAVALIVTGRSRIALLMIIAFWLGVVGALNHSLPKKKVPHGVMFPLAIYETVNFLQPRRMNIEVSPSRISSLTLKTLDKYHPTARYLDFYDSDYWDPLVFFTNSPDVTAFSKADKKIIEKEFIKYNVWHNFPRFMGSRTNIFLVAALAQGSIPAINYAPYMIAEAKSKSKYRKFAMPTENLSIAVFDFSYRYRWLLWTPFLGLILIGSTLRSGVIKRNATLIILSTTMAAQFFAIFIFSIAGEYRYLLPFFAIPLALLPALASQSPSRHIKPD